MLGLIDLLTRHVWIYICINFYKKLIKVGHLIYRTHLIRSIYAGFHKCNLFLASLLNIFFSPWRRYLRKKRKLGNYNFIAKPIFFKTFKLGPTLSIIKHSSYIYIYIYSNMSRQKIDEPQHWCVLLLFSNFLYNFLHSWSKTLKMMRERQRDVTWSSSMLLKLTVLLICNKL